MGIRFYVLKCFLNFAEMTKTWEMMEILDFCFADIFGNHDWVEREGTWNGWYSCFTKSPYASCFEGLRITQVLQTAKNEERSSIAWAYHWSLGHQWTGIPYRCIAPDYQVGRCVFSDQHLKKRGSYSFYRAEDISRAGGHVFGTSLCSGGKIGRGQDPYQRRPRSGSSIYIVCHH